MNITAEKYYDDNLENYNLLNKIDPMTAKQAMQIMEEYHQAKLKLLGIANIVSSVDLKEPTFSEMRKEVLSNKSWKKKDGLYWHFKWGTKTLREAYKIATS